MAGNPLVPGKGTQKMLMVPSDIWAGQNITQNSKPSDAKIADGWKFGEKPPATIFNWSWNLIMQNMVHIMENGMPVWDQATSYNKDSLSLYNGRIWLSLSDQNKNHKPSSNSTFWVYATDTKAASVAEVRAGIERAKFVSPWTLKQVYYSKTEIDTKFGNYYTKAEVDALIAAYKPHILRCKK